MPPPTYDEASIPSTADRCLARFREREETATRITMFAIVVRTMMTSNVLGETFTVGSPLRHRPLVANPSSGGPDDTRARSGWDHSEARRDDFLVTLRTGRSGPRRSGRLRWIRAL